MRIRFIIFKYSITNLRPERYCRPKQAGAYPALLDFIAKVKAHVADVTVTAIDGLEGVNIGACARIAAELGVKFRARILDRIG